ncbi:MAG: hypothetical protein GX102_10120 [Porphyromonadaceae bacterium]|jgi:cell fate regulator YaaT (PSP1 superfamily)|nr:hypothetical protein [Porphyromonadaceae bacterium]
MDYGYYIGGGGISCGGCTGTSNKKLSVYDWLSDLPETVKSSDYVEVQFKSTRKGFYQNVNNLDLRKGDMVAVESSPGHDIGEVTLVGKLVLLQMKKYNIDLNKYEIKKIYRRVRDADMEKYHEAKAKEQDTMIKSRQIAANMNLSMKISDVEYQGDGNKAIFYYIADERVDFRQLIKVFAETFHVRIEMKQIGARQEAGRVGGIGPCGRELCCSSWLTNFQTVSTSAARYQDLSLNPQKLAGLCGKLKCCLNYELDMYIEAQKDLPSKEIELETTTNTYYHFKTDIFKALITYSTDKNIPANLVTIHADRAKAVIWMNKKGHKPEHLEELKDVKEKKVDYQNAVGQDSVNRFDDQKRKYSGRSRKSKNKKDESKTTESRSGNNRRRNKRNNRNNSNQNETTI